MRPGFRAFSPLLAVLLAAFTLLAADERADPATDFATVKLFFVDPLLLDEGKGFGEIPSELHFQDVDLYLNDKFVGNAMIRNRSVMPALNLAPGDYQLRIESEGYQRVEETLTVLRHGSTQWLVVRLKPLEPGDASSTADAWAPAQDPDPQAILQEAYRDAQAKRYDIALAKHRWFHRHALSITPSLYGVRLSFALGSWHELGKAYPPAMEELKEARDVAARRVKQGEDLRQSFHDMAAINRTLGADALTRQAFEALDSSDSEAAKEVFELAQPALVRGKAYKLLEKYVDPKKDFAEMKEAFEHGKQLGGENKRFQELRLAERRFTNEAATLVAILVISGRTEEAKEIAASAKSALEDTSFHDQIDEALEGTVPEPWP